MKFWSGNRTQSVVDTLVSDFFLTNQNAAYLWTNSLKFHTVCFYCMPSWELSKYIEAKLQTTCFYLIILSFFKKNKKRLELVSQPRSLDKIWRQTFLLLYSIKCPSFIVWLSLLCEILGNMRIANVC